MIIHIKRNQTNGCTCIIALLAIIALSPIQSAQAQSEESDPAPVKGKYEADPLPPPDRPFIIPDVPQSVVAKTEVKERWFTLKPGLVVIEDYTAFEQDAKSLSQVGKQKDQWDPRAVRAMIRGSIGTDYKISYFVGGEYTGFDTEPDDYWNFTDVSFTFPIGGPATKLTVGKTKETFAYEMV